MASRLATVSKDEILAVNKAAAATNTKRQDLARWRLLVGRKKKFLLNFQQNLKK